ncbi:ATP--cobalamin adenosyltransferase [Vallitalea longa]|uniref:Corrinoid adenosyltransferase n=1 Tax=Vallitalea longa TaxID=2936439 RepID=A0A9W5Y838_9FIRM|nr:cob(I)yrinic acid a,c-diamide adenosyltransferase [Vallitalea longa]GKX28169.1 ATP--cobalamin adenosyltransferase [Vallitalea longa]
MGSKNHVFTKTGDSGYTKLFNGTSVDKDSIFIETNGNFDELTSSIGLVKAYLNDKIMIEQLEKVQTSLIKLMGVIAGLDNDNKLVEDEVNELEKWIIEYESKYPIQKKFILAGVTKVSALIDVARTVCRRAERSLVRCCRERNINNSYPKYINRLSDYLYVVARYQEFNQLIIDRVKDVLGDMNSKVKVAGNSINLEQAKRVIDKVRDKAEDLDLKVVIAVVNKEGNPVGINVMDDAYIASYDIALNKAFTSVSLKMSTYELSKLAQPNEALYGIQFTNNGRIVIFGGGIPLMNNNGEIIGGLGVSGGSAKEDTMLADYGGTLVH